MMMMMTTSSTDSFEELTYNVPWWKFIKVVIQPLSHTMAELPNKSTLRIQSHIIVPFYSPCKQKTGVSMATTNNM